MKPLRVLMMVSGLIVAVASLTTMWFAMRAVMGVGGACAEGGAYVIQTHCPDGTAVIMTLAIPVGLAGLALYVIGNRSLPGPDLTLLAWPALFVSLGWNFLDAALPLPDGDTGGAIGALVCGIVFVVMGVVPLVALRQPGRLRSVFWAHAADGDAGGPLRLRSRRRAAITLLKQAESDRQVTAEELARVRSMLEPDGAEANGAARGPAQGSLPLAMLQLLAIIVGVALGSWLATSMLG